MVARGTGPADQEGGHLVRLMVEYQAGRMEAFESLYAALAPDLGRHLDASSFGGVTKDLVQETFLEMHRARHTYLPPLPVRPWAFGIARNVLRRHRRTAWRRARIEAISGDGLAEGPPATEGTGIDGRDLDQALQRLPEGRRSAFELHHVHGFSFAEIGRMLRIPEGAAKLRSSRAMGALRALFGVGGGRRDE